MGMKRIPPDTIEYRPDSRDLWHRQAGEATKECKTQCAPLRLVGIQMIMRLCSLHAYLDVDRIFDIHVFDDCEYPSRIGSAC